MGVAIAKSIRARSCGPCVHEIVSVLWKEKVDVLGGEDCLPGGTV